MQINAIILFVDILLQQSTRTGSTTDTISIKDSITLLLGIANTSPAGSDNPVPQYLDIPRTAIKALGHLLGVISVSEFVSSIDIILKSNNNLVILYCIFLEQMMIPLLDRNRSAEFTGFTLGECLTQNETRHCTNSHWHSRPHLCHSREWRRRSARKSCFGCLPINRTVGS